MGLTALVRSATSIHSLRRLQLKTFLDHLILAEIRVPHLRLPTTSRQLFQIRSILPMSTVSSASSRSTQWNWRLNIAAQSLWSFCSNTQRCLTTPIKSWGCHEQQERTQPV